LHCFQWLFLSFQQGWSLAKFLSELV
jgi:hypothetical protein